MRREKQKINHTKSWFSEKINKLDKYIARLTRRRKKKEKKDPHQQNYK